MSRVGRGQEDGRGGITGGTCATWQRLLSPRETALAATWRPGPANTTREVFMNWLRSLIGLKRGPIGKQSRCSLRCRPGLEGLETRFLLATGITEFASLPTASSQPDAITTGPD